MADPGWYANPSGEGLRWWDGSRWTDDVHSTGTAPADPPEARRYPLRYAAVGAGDQGQCERFIDANAPAMRKYLRLAQGVPGSQSTCGFVGVTGDRVAGLAVSEVEVKGTRATATFDGSPTVMHLSESGGGWVIDGIS